MSDVAVPVAGPESEPALPHAVPEIAEPSQPPSGPILRVLHALDRLVLRVEQGLILLVVVVMLGSVVIQVVGRLLNQSITGAMETSVFGMLALALLSASVTTHYRRHISIDILSRAIPPPARTVLMTGINLIGAVLLLYLARVAWFFMAVNREFGDVSPALKVPYWWLQSLLPFAFAVIACRFFLHFLEDGKRVLTRNWLPRDLHGHADIRM